MQLAFLWHYLALYKKTELKCSKSCPWQTYLKALHQYWLQTYSLELGISALCHSQLYGLKRCLEAKEAVVKKELTLWKCPLMQQKEQAASLQCQGCQATAYPNQTLLKLSSCTSKLSSQQITNDPWMENLELYIKLGTREYLINTSEQVYIQRIKSLGLMHWKNTNKSTQNAIFFIILEWKYIYSWWCKTLSTYWMYFT